MREGRVRKVLWSGRAPDAARAVAGRRPPRRRGAPQSGASVTSQSGPQQQCPLRQRQDATRPPPASSHAGLQRHGALLCGRRPGRGPPVLLHGLHGRAERRHHGLPQEHQAGQAGRRRGLRQGLLHHQVRQRQRGHDPAQRAPVQELHGVPAGPRPVLARGTAAQGDHSRRAAVRVLTLLREAEADRRPHHVLPAAVQEALLGPAAVQVRPRGQVPREVRGGRGGGGRRMKSQPVSQSSCSVFVANRCL